MAGRGVPLSVVAEAEALSPTDDALAADPPRSPGVIQRMVNLGLRTPEDPEVFNAAGGPSAPDWARSAGGGLRYPVDLARVRDVHYAPEYGAAIDPEGRVFRATVNGATYVTPTLEALPGVTRAGDVSWFAPPDDVAHWGSASIFVPWGARFNYGHFLLDALPGLTLLADQGLLQRFPAISPRLEPWQRELLDLLLTPGETLEEVDDPLVWVDDLLFCSTMDHFLHQPNAPINRVRQRILAALPAAPAAANRRVYLSRRSQGKRRMVNEAALEAALQDRGFLIAEPERLSVADQIELFRSAEVVVAATGAALANVLFMQPAAKLFEIQPVNYQGIWARALAQYVGAHWHGYFCPSPIQEKTVHVEGELRPGLDFSWALPLDDFLGFVDRSLDGSEPEACSGPADA